ncbi:MAG TPA: hypothetical protein VMC86_11795 [Gemmatimonadales bacterium]|nr:hypothetical protein [Gemmatimonadales bacterium]
MPTWSHRLGYLPLALGALFLETACKSSPASPGTPASIAIVNRSNLKYNFGVAIFTTPAQSDTLSRSNGNDSVCTQVPAAGNAYEVFYGSPVDTADPPLQTQVIIGGESNGWLLFFGPKAVGNDTLEMTLTATGAC